MNEELQDKIVGFIDDREQQGIDTVPQHVAHRFALPAQDTNTELTELLEAGRIEMLQGDRLRVVYPFRVKV